MLLFILIGTKSFAYISTSEMKYLESKEVAMASWSDDGSGYDGWGYDSYSYEDDYYYDDYESSGFIGLIFFLGFFIIIVVIIFIIVKKSKSNLNNVLAKNQKNHNIKIPIIMTLFVIGLIPNMYVASA